MTETVLFCGAVGWFLHLLGGCFSAPEFIRDHSEEQYAQVVQAIGTAEGCWVGTAANVSRTSVIWGWDRAC